VALLQPTSPLRTEKDIIQAWDLYINNKASSVTSVCKLTHPYQWTYSLSEDGKMSSLFTDNKKRSQDYPDSYRLNGAIYINSVKQVIEENTIITNENCQGFIMNDKNSIDIDNESDFDLAEYYLDKLK
jgi:N-acylneuraminate cytidylyltransferase